MAPWKQQQCTIAKVTVSLLHFTIQPGCFKNKLSWGRRSKYMWTELLLLNPVANSPKGLQLMLSVSHHITHIFITFHQKRFCYVLCHNISFPHYMSIQLDSISYQYYYTISDLWNCKYTALLGILVGYRQYIPLRWEYTGKSCIHYMQRHYILKRICLFIDNFDSDTIAWKSWNDYSLCI